MWGNGRRDTRYGRLMQDSLLLCLVGSHRFDLVRIRPRQFRVYATGPPSPGDSRGLVFSSIQEFRRNQAISEMIGNLIRFNAAWCALERQSDSTLMRTLKRTAMLCARCKMSRDQVGIRRRAWRDHVMEGWLAKSARNGKGQTFRRLRNVGHQQ
jgi:hypothetical protein